MRSFKITVTTSIKFNDKLTHVFENVPDQQAEIFKTHVYERGFVIKPNPTTREVISPLFISKVLIEEIIN